MQAVIIALALLTMMTCGSHRSFGGPPTRDGCQGHALCPSPSFSTTQLRSPNESPSLGNHPHIAVVVMENHEYDNIIGNPCCPYINSLVSMGTLFASYDAVSHPSLPNYLAMTSGGTDGKSGTDSIIAGEINLENVFHQVAAGGLTWASYEEQMPSACYRGPFFGAPPHDYALKHDPAMAYQDIADSSLCNNVVPYTQLPKALPNFTFVTPDECDDMHSCSARTGDDWLRANVPTILARLGSSGRLIITFDEGTSGQGGGGHVVTIELGPGVPVQKDGTSFNHYGLLAGIEDAFGLALLQNARSARPLPLFLASPGD